MLPNTSQLLSPNLGMLSFNYKKFKLATYSICVYINKNQKQYIYLFCILTLSYMRQHHFPTKIPDTRLLSTRVLLLLK